MYEYKCKIIRIVDGDTVDVDISLGFGAWLKDERVRVVGIDCPECRTRDLIEKQFGIAAKDFVESLLPINSYQVLQSKQFEGKFGRILGDFVIEDSFLSKMIVKNNHAVPYIGNQEQRGLLHLKNREYLINNGFVVKIK